jgi:ABC-2 type transport system permease protein
VSEPASGEVFDLGYRGYEGERTGRFGRRRAIWRDGIRISLGLGRGLGAKFTSWLLLGLALVPIVVLVVISAFLSPLQEARSDFDLPSYADYFNWAHIPLVLFAAVVAPLLLCPDRREGVLSLYAARPITPADYVGSRWAAVLTVTALAGWLPLTVLFVWNALDASSPLSWLVDHWDLVPRILAAGATVALVLTTVALFAASFATRRAYAAVGILAAFFVGSAIGGIAEENFAGPVSDALSLASVPQALIDSVHWIFSDPRPDRPLPGWASLLWLAGLTALLGFGLVRRTERLVRG